MKLSQFLPFILLYCPIISSSPTLQVFCTNEFIRLKITLDSNYFGIIYTLPNRETCNIIGSGDTKLAFYIPLKEPGRNQCGVVTRNGVHSVALTIRHHHIIETAKDYTFLVQCSESVPAQNGELGEINVALNLFEGNRIVNNAVVGHRYSLEVEMPKPNYEISSCITFDGGADLRYHNLLDENGCPLDDSILSPFRRGMKKLTFFADFTMFRFNGSHEFNIQCSVIKCQNRCSERNCVRDLKTLDNLLHDATDQINQNFKTTSSLATTRLTVRDHSKANEIKKYIGCHYSEQPELIGLSLVLALLVTFTVVLTVTAFHNRPFRCDWYARDMPIMQDIAKLDEPKSQLLSAKHYCAKSIESSSESKNFCEQNRETTIVKEIIHTTIATPENPAHSRMTSPLSSKSSRSTLTSSKNWIRSVHRDSTIKSTSRLSPMRKVQLRRHAKLPRNKSFVSAICQKKLTELEVKMNLPSHNVETPCPLSPSHSCVSAANEQRNFYETPSNKRQAKNLSTKSSIINSHMEQTCRNNSPVYINVDSSSQSLICPIEVARKKRMKNNKSIAAAELKKWRI